MVFEKAIPESPQARDVAWCRYVENVASAETFSEHVGEKL